LMLLRPFRRILHRTSLIAVAKSPSRSSTANQNLFVVLAR
jgi:hypothetical protein